MKNLNREGIAGPFGGAGVRARSHGNAKRGTGILNNELYVGRMVWNRLRYVKNPDTGKRVSRLNPAAEWIAKSVPELRIISDEFWDAAKDATEGNEARGHGQRQHRRARRPQYLFSGLTKCGVCGSGFIMASTNRLSCFGARYKGICDNRLTIRRDEVEAACSQGATREAAEPRTVRRILRRVHARDEPASDGASRQPDFRRSARSSGSSTRIKKLLEPDAWTARSRPAKSRTR